MPLELIPTYDDMSMKQTKEFVEGVRIRRMAAVVAYQQAENLKLSAEKNKITTRLDGQLTMLAKELERLNRVLETVDKRIARIDVLKNELTFVDEMIDAE